MDQNIDGNEAKTGIQTFTFEGSAIQDALLEQADAQAVCIPMHGTINALYCQKCLQYFKFADFASDYLKADRPCIQCIVYTAQLSSSAPHQRSKALAKQASRPRPSIVTYHQSGPAQARLDRCISQALVRDETAQVTLVVIGGISFNYDNKTTQEAYVRLLKAQAHNSAHPILVLWLNIKKSCPAVFLRLENVTVKQYLGDIQEVAAEVGALRRKKHS